jgi:formate-dependent phosphoribosylglycinamide formyltransferase (GAR transformylase)
MKTAALVAPFFADNTLRYLRALAELPGVRPAVLSQDPFEKLPADLQRRLDVVRVPDCLSGPDLAAGCRKLQQHFGRLDVLMGALEQLQLPMAQARELAGVPGMGVRVAGNFRDKAQMKDVLRAAGLPVARHALIESDAAAIDFVHHVGLPIILKPVDGLGSRGTFRVSDEADLRSALRALRPSMDRPAQAEEFVVGSEQTFETVTIGGKPVWHSGTYYLNRPLEVIENPWMQYCVLLPREANLPEFEAFRPVNTAALAALGMETGLSHMEWFRRQDGSHVISEVGARPPGVQIMPLNSLGHETDMVGRWVRLMALGEWQPVTRKHAVGVAFFRGQGRGRRVVAVHGLEQAQRAAGKLVVDRKLPVVGQPKADGYEGEGWAIVQADDTATVKEALRQLVTSVQVELG